MRGGILLAFAIASLSCGSTTGDPQSQAASRTVTGPPSSAAATAPANCDALARITPASAPELARVDLGDGTQRITSAEAGYSIVVPTSWYVSPGVLTDTTRSFGQAHLTSYDPKSTDRRTTWLAHGRMQPPDLGIRLDVELWQNPKREAADEYARSVHIGPDQTAVLPGRVVTIAGQRAYHALIQDEFRFQPATGPLEVTRQTRMLWLVPVLRDDRMLVIYATPGESPLRGEVASAVATLQLSKSIVSQLPVIHQRDAVLKRWLYDKNGAPIAGRRAEAKLMSYADSDAAMSGNLLLRIDRDPDELFWLVAVSGPDLPRGRGPMGQSSPAPIAWIQYQTPATNDRYEGTGTQYSTAGSWPTGFDALPDLCR